MSTEIKDQQALQKLLNQGFNQLSQGNIKEASDCCQQALKIKPDLVQAHFLVGLIALEAKDRRTAFQAFNSVVKLDEKHVAAWAQLAKLFMTDGQVNRADSALQKARSIVTNEPMVHDLIGTTLSLMGDHEDAGKSFLKANQYQTDYPPFMLNYANNMIYHGDNDEALIILNNIVSIQQNNPQAHWALSSASKAKDTDHIQQMQKLINNGRQNGRALAFYHYAIGKEYEDLQQWDRAFDAIEKGAKARRSTIEYDEASEIAMFEFIEKNYTRKWFDGLAEGNPDNSPIFVLGQPRTGTTLVERIITSHSQVHSAGELQQFGLAIRRLTGHQDPKRFTREYFEKAQQLEPSKIGALYLKTIGKTVGDTPHFVDKLPQNYLLIPLILKALPNAKIVHLTRNPMDACFASYKQLFADAYLHSYDQAEMARHHARYRHLMGVWRQRFPNTFFDISYEATAQDLEPNARALIEFLELPWEDACLNFHQQKAAVATASASQVREPAHTRSIDRWKKYQGELTIMTDALKQHGISVE
ncbi:MAG: tetratricopeptide (TPR) repeat protein [Chitinophagales bacterium]|jgi:tetratricopeptide (TPR) repeat protein